MSLRRTGTGRSESDAAPSKNVTFSPKMTPRNSGCGHKVSHSQNGSFASAEVYLDDCREDEVQPPYVTDVRERRFSLLGPLDKSKRKTVSPMVSPPLSEADEETVSKYTWDVISKEICEWHYVMKTGRPSWWSPLSRNSRMSQYHSYHRRSSREACWQCKNHDADAAKATREQRRKALSDTVLGSDDDVNELAHLIAVQLLSSCFTLPPEAVSNNAPSAFYYYDNTGAHNFPDPRLISSLRMHAHFLYTPCFGYQARNTSPARLWEDACDGPNSVLLSPRVSSFRSPAAALDRSNSAKQRRHFRHPTEVEALQIDNALRVARFATSSVDGSASTLDHTPQLWNSHPSIQSASIPVSPAAIPTSNPLTTHSPSPSTTPPPLPPRRTSTSLSLTRGTNSIRRRSTSMYRAIKERQELHTPVVRASIKKRWNTFRRRFGPVASSSGAPCPETTSADFMSMASANRPHPSQIGAPFDAELPSTPWSRDMPDFLAADSYEHRRASKERRRRMHECGSSQSSQSIQSISSFKSRGSQRSTMRHNTPESSFAEEIEERFNGPRSHRTIFSPEVRTMDAKTHDLSCTTPGCSSKHTRPVLNKLPLFARRSSREGKASRNSPVSQAMPNWPPLRSISPGGPSMFNGKDGMNGMKEPRARTVERVERRRSERRSKSGLSEVFSADDLDATTAESSMNITKATTMTFHTARSHSPVEEAEEEAVAEDDGNGEDETVFALGMAVAMDLGGKRERAKVVDVRPSAATKSTDGASSANGVTGANGVKGAPQVPQLFRTSPSPPLLDAVVGRLDSLSRDRSWGSADDLPHIPSAASASSPPLGTNNGENHSRQPRQPRELSEPSDSSSVVRYGESTGEGSGSTQRARAESGDVRSGDGRSESGPASPMSPKLVRMSSTGTQLFTPSDEGVEVDGLPMGPGAERWDSGDDGGRRVGRERSFL